MKCMKVSTSSTDFFIDKMCRFSCVKRSHRNQVGLSRKGIVDEMTALMKRLIRHPAFELDQNSGEQIGFPGWGSDFPSY